GIFKQLFGFWLFKNCRISSAQLPSMEKRRPIDERNQRLKGNTLALSRKFDRFGCGKDADPGEFRLGNIFRLPFDLGVTPAGFLNRYQWFRLLLAMVFPKFLILPLNIVQEISLQGVIEQISDYAN